MPFIVKELEDMPAGVSIALADLRKDKGDCLAPGCFIGKDERGLGHLCKSVVLHADVLADAVKMNVDKKHHILVGEFLSCKDKPGVKACKVISVDTSELDYDVITVSAALGTVAVEAAEGVEAKEAVELKKDDTLIVVAGEDTTGGLSVLKYIPDGITKEEVDLTKNHGQSGVLVRGTVNVANMAYGAPKVLREAIGALIRFK